MGVIRIEFEPFIAEGARQFIVSGLDSYNIAATNLPDYFPVNFVLRGERAEVRGGLLGQTEYRCHDGRVVTTAS